MALLLLLLLLTAGEELTTETASPVVTLRGFTDDEPGVL